MSKLPLAALSPSCQVEKKNQIKASSCFQIPGLQAMYYDTHFKIWLHL